MTKVKIYTDKKGEYILIKKKKKYLRAASDKDRKTNLKKLRDAIKKKLATRSKTKKK